MSGRLTVTELVRNFSDYVNRVAYQGESFTLVRGRKSVAELRPTPAGRRLSDLPEIVRGLPRLTGDEARAFARDLDAARDALSSQPPESPWES
ncbi:hypothetical protein HQ576_16310 [bacterium]|nr:hypothetical protein [bacterium]